MLTSVNYPFVGYGTLGKHGFTVVFCTNLFVVVSPLFVVVVIIWLVVTGCFVDIVPCDAREKGYEIADLSLGNGGTCIAFIIYFR